MDFDHAVDINGAILQGHIVSGTIGNVRISYSEDKVAWTYITAANGYKREVGSSKSR